MRASDFKFTRRLAGLLAVAVLCLTLESVSVGAPSSVELPGIHNFFRATTNVFSGSQPEGDAGFAALQKLGVRTIISVDGAKPEVERAAQYGLRYVHLPFGYDGIPGNRVAELARAASVLPGPVYVHCHHGKHRGPAAVSIICMADAGWTPAQAETFLHEAGTGPEYPGLYRAAREFKPLTAEQLESVPTNFPAVAQTTSIVETMVAMDAIYDRLKLIQAADWKTPVDHSDLVPAHEALMLVEQFRELSRTEDTAARELDFRAKLNVALQAVEDLQAQIKAQSTSPNAAFKQVGQTCVDCHRKYRNE